MSDRWQVIHGDCRDFLQALPADVAAVVSDPPYGMSWDVNTTRFSGGATRRGAGRSDWHNVAGDDTPFDPASWLAFPEVVLWGANHYAARLLVGTTLVWVKRADHAFGTFLGDAEVAWEKGGHGVYCFRQHFGGATRADDAGGVTAHPTQKPVELMRWCLHRLKLAPDSLVLDPYCGSGTTGVAAMLEGFRFLGIEREAQYVEIARRRIADAAAQTNLFAEPGVTYQPAPEDR